MLPEVGCAKSQASVPPRSVSTLARTITHWKSKEKADVTATQIYQSRIYIMNLSARVIRLFPKTVILNM